MREEPPRKIMYTVKIALHLTTFYFERTHRHHFSSVTQVMTTTTSGNEVLVHNIVNTDLESF